MNCACTATTRNKGREQRILYDRTHAQFVESVPGQRTSWKQNMHRTGKEARTGEVLFRTGNRITPPTARVKQSEWLRLKLPLQTCPVSSKIHLSATSIQQFTKCKFGSFRTAIAPLVQLSSPVWIQRLKDNLADNTTDKHSNLNSLSDSIDSNSLLH